ncbi:hypothetical protein [Tardiphaga sp. 768_D3_N2_1]|uniref:hypothetical protein n=1 Tax=Tardiphaga sp. 768_D3_N2_1 TaxID=3240783 RepID=UPI003F887266
MNKRSDASDHTTNTHEFRSAAEELSTLEKLASGLSIKLSELLRLRPNFSRENSAAEFAIHDVRQSSRKGYEELAQNCYGRTVIGEEIDQLGNSQRKFKYRITQANVGYLEDGCNVLARNSPIASKLVAAEPGDESEVNAPGGERFLVAQEVRTFDGPTSLLSSNQKPNFRSMQLSLLGREEQTVVTNLRALVVGLPSEVESSTTPALTSSFARSTPNGANLEAEANSLPVSVDPMWVEDWSRVVLGDSETVALSQQFFTRTTRKQENALSNPRGLTFVEGVAGSGKTSIALGRLKFFANFSTGEYRDEYGLKNAAAADLSPANMIGFVLSHSLKRYLKEAASALGVGQLPVQDFQEFRADLSNRFGLTKYFRRNSAQVSHCRNQVPWLVAMDVAVARSIGRRLQEVVANAAKMPALVKTVIVQHADRLLSTQLNDEFNLAGLAEVIVDAVMVAEYRAREVAINERIARETNRNIRYDLQLEINSIREEEDRRTISPLARQLLGILAIGDLANTAVQSGDFLDLVRQAFGIQGRSNFAEVEKAVVSFREMMSGADDGSEKFRSLSDDDMSVLVTLAAMIADGFSRVDAPSHLYQIRRRTAVFIDEVQDFTEVEILLMGMVVTSTYQQITLSGDRQQRLQEWGAESYDRLFPFISRGRRNSSVFLDHNFRQRENLGLLSAGIRSLFKDDSSAIGSKYLGPAALAHTFEHQHQMAQTILDRILTVDAYATIVVVTPSEREARQWHDLLRDGLAAYHRPALLSHRDDLTRRNDIHFTEVRETKGLEFDVVIVPDISLFDLDGLIGKNQLYVAVSRPRQALLLGCRESELSRSGVDVLLQQGLIKPRPIPRTERE